MSAGVDVSARRAGGSPRSVFAQQLNALFEAAGKPTLSRVADRAKERMQPARGPGSRGNPATLQRISDWRTGRNIPSQFDTLAPVLLTLFDLTKPRSATVAPELLDLTKWRQLWKAAEEWRPELDESLTICPYRGLTSYRAVDAEWFFGRDRATEAFTAVVLDAVATADRGELVVLVGASGAGKSSLLQAGVIPAITATAGEWAAVTVTPGAHPLDALTDALGGPPDDWVTHGQHLLIVDQFEELFTTCRDQDARDAFLSALEGLAGRRESGSATVVLAVRADFYARCLDYPVLESALEKRSYVLGPMRLTELTEAITGPARAAGLELEPGLAELVITELCGLGEHRDRHNYDPGALPLLSHVMAATWQHRERLRLTVDGYRKAGGVVGSVAATAERAWDELTVSQRVEAKPLLLGLVTVGADDRDTRRPGSRFELCGRAADSEAAESVLEKLVQARLITSDADRVVFTHEIVLSAWPRLRAWIDEDRVGYLVRQRLDTDAADWVAAGRDQALLYRGTRLTATQEVTSRLAATGDAAEFLTAAQRFGRRNRRRAATTQIGLALFGVGVLVLAIAAYGQSRLTSQQHDNAVLAAVLADADSLRDTDPSLSAQLDLVAHQLRPNDPEVRSRLLTTQNLPLATPLAGHHGGVRQVAYQPGGRLLASAGEDHTVRLWDVSDPANPHQVGAPLDFGEPVIAVVFDSDATTLVAAGAHAIRTWSVRDAAHPVASTVTPIGGDAAVIAVVFSADGRMAAVADDSHTVRLWSTGDATEQYRAGAVLPVPSQIRAMAFAPNRAWLAIATGDSVQLWTITDTGAAVLRGQPISVQQRQIDVVAVSPDGATLAVGTGENSYNPAFIGDAGLVLWDTSDPSRARQLGTAVTVTVNSDLESIAFDPDGRRLVVGDRHGATVWNLVDREHPRLLGEPLRAPSPPCPDVSLLLVCENSPAAMVFSPDSHTVVTGGTLGLIRLWSLPPATVVAPYGSSNGGNFGGDDTLVTAVTDGRATLWDARDHRNLRQVADLGPGPHHDYMATPQISHDGSLVVTATGSPPVLRMLDVTDPAHVRTLFELPDVIAGWFSPDARMLVTLTGFAQWSFQIWDISDRTHPIRLSSPVPLSTSRTALTEAIFPADGRDFITLTAEVTAAGAQEYALNVWDLSNPADPREIARLPREASTGLGNFATTPDGRTMVTVAADTIQVWDIGNLPRISKVGDPISTHGLNIGALDFTPDGQMMVTGSADSAVRLWDLRNRAHPQLIGHSITVPDGTNWSVVADPTGRYVVGTGNGVLSVWDLDETHAIARICAITSTVLTREQWQTRLPQLPYRSPC